MPASFRYLIDRAARAHGSRSAIICGADQRTFIEVHERASRLGNGLHARGLRPGNRVAVLASNRSESLEIEIGLAQAGLVRVAMNARATAKQHLAVLRDCEAKALLYTEDLSTIADEVLAEFAPEVVVRLGDAKHYGDVASYERLLQSATSAPPDADPQHDDLYCLFYTSGTTGAPKGVMLSFRAQLAVAFGLLLEFGPVRAGEKALLTQPLSHGGGFFLLPWFLSGATSVVMPRFNPTECLELCERHGAQTLKVVPTMLLELLAQGIEPPALPHLRKVIYGASPMPANRLAELIDLFGPVFAQLYGQAEAPMCITVLPEEDHVGELLSSAGRPWRNVEVRVVDADRVDVAPGESGEVIVRGDHLMSGYWRQHAATAEVLRDGYLHSRDVATVDERGYLYLLGRSDEMIISGGFNVAPRVVEEVLGRHPAVHEAFVLGMPHATLGEEVTAFVTLRAGQLATPDELIDYTRGDLGYQRPRALRIVPELPRNAYGKVVAAELRKLHQEAEPAAR